MKDPVIIEITERLRKEPPVIVPGELERMFVRTILLLACITLVGFVLI